MNNRKIKIYKRILKELSDKQDGAEDFINFQEKVSAEKVISIFLCCLFNSKIVS